MSEPKKNKGGRPKKEVDEKQVYELAAIMCTLDEIGRIVGCSHDTLQRRFASVIKDGQAHAKASIRRDLFARKSKSDSVLMFLGKTILGLRENALTDEEKESAEAAVKKALAPLQELREKWKQKQEK